MNCSCAGCIKDTDDISGTYCDYHSLVSSHCMIDLSGAKFEKAYARNDELAVALSECKRPIEISAILYNGGISPVGIQTMMCRRY